MAANVQLGSAKTGRRWCFEFSVQRQKLKASLSRFAPPPPAQIPRSTSGKMLRVRRWMRCPGRRCKSRFAPTGVKGDFPPLPGVNPGSVVTGYVPTAVPAPAALVQERWGRRAQKGPGLAQFGEETFSPPARAGWSDRDRRSPQPQPPGGRDPRGGAHRRCLPRGGLGWRGCWAKR